MTMTLIRLFCLFSFLPALPGRAETSVWKVQNGDGVMYLGGTCHMLRKTDFPLPKEFDRAYEASARVVFEVDQDEINKADFQKKLMARARYPDGETVQDHLSDEAYGALKDYCQTHHLPLAALEQFKPSMLMITLSVMELLKTGVTLEGVDHHFNEKAKKDGKPRDALETVDEQLEFIVTMADGIENMLVLQSLEDLRTLRQDFDAMVHAWRTGEEEALYTLFLEDMKSETPTVHKKLILNRNRNWIPKLENYLQTAETEFVLVGAAHMPGEDGVLELLRKKGYTVRKL